jgi:hypothetical protein
MEWLMPALVTMIVAGAGVALWFLRRWRNGSMSIEQMAHQFRDRKSVLEKLFFATAASSGKPRGLRWKECQWNDAIEWVREKATGRLHALVGVTISFEAIEGGDMEGVEAVGNLRNATAVFFFDGEWRTAGRVVFNLNPDEAVIHFKDGYERVGVQS